MPCPGPDSTPRFWHRGGGSSRADKFEFNQAQQTATQQLQSRSKLQISYTGMAAFNPSMEVSGGLISSSLLAWARQRGFPDETISRIEATPVPKEATPFFVWLESVCIPETDAADEKDDTTTLHMKLQVAKQQQKNVEEKLSIMRKKISNLVEKPVDVALRDEISDLDACINDIRGHDYDYKRARVRGAVGQLLRQEAILTSCLCEMEESANETNEEFVEDDLRIESQMKRFERICDIHRGLEHTSMCADIAKSRATALVKLKSQLQYDLPRVETLVPDVKPELLKVRNDLSRLRKRYANLKSEKKNYDLLQEKQRLLLSCSRGVKISETERQKKVVEAMTLQGARYETAIEIIRKETKFEMTKKSKLSQCLDFLDAFVSSS